MFFIRAPSLGRAHELIIKKIIKDGERIITEDGEVTLELPEPSNIHVATPLASPMISPNCMFGPKAMEKYVYDFFEGSNGSFAYTYRDRIMFYPQHKIDDKGSRVMFFEYDQIEGIIEKLKKNPQSRRAQAITWIPAIDLEAKEPPCLQRMQFFIRDGKLNMYVEFRSNDMLSALGANMYLMANIQKHIADRLEINEGWYSHTSVSSHIYYLRDIEELKKFEPTEVEQFLASLKTAISE